MCLTIASVECRADMKVMDFDYDKGLMINLRALNCEDCKGKAF